MCLAFLSIVFLCVQSISWYVVICDYFCIMFVLRASLPCFCVPAFCVIIVWCVLLLLYSCCTLVFFILFCMVCILYYVVCLLYYCINWYFAISVWFVHDCVLVVFIGCMQFGVLLSIVLYSFMLYCIICVIFVFLFLCYCVLLLICCISTSVISY